jgi:lipid-A-disaccharide synthase-like uncharacterized protein
MDENLRNFLYYPLGILPSIFFSSRFLIQWIKSEKLKVSHVDPIFWQLSLAGNILAALHYFIQFQYIFLLIQTVNALISLRNLDLMREGKAQYSLKSIIICLPLFLIALSLIFFYQHGVPTTLEIAGKNMGTSWHIFGAVGGFIFASRFWIQWWNAEKKKQSTLNENFWILSILGGLLTLIYAFRINDTISVINYSFGMIPYVRNLALLTRSK